MCQGQQPVTAQSSFEKLVQSALVTQSCVALSLLLSKVSLLFFTDYSPSLQSVHFWSQTRGGQAVVMELLDKQLPAA